MTDEAPEPDIILYQFPANTLAAGGIVQFVLAMLPVVFAHNTTVAINVAKDDADDDA